MFKKNASNQSLGSFLRRLFGRERGLMTTSIIVTKADGTVIDYGVVSRGRVSFKPKKG